DEQYRFVCDPREYQVLGNKWHSEIVSQGLDTWLSPWELNWPTIK
ncbi:RNA pseudouridine synthase, partial [Vibrio parahaemolyticus]